MGATKPTKTGTFFPSPSRASSFFLSFLSQTWEFLKNSTWGTKKDEPKIDPQILKKSVGMMECEIILSTFC